MSGEVERRIPERVMVVVDGEVVDLMTGEAVDLDDPRACALALDALRQFERGPLSDAKRLLSDGVVAHYRLTGRRTLELSETQYAEVSDSPRTFVDPDVLEERLREAGMPDENIEALIKTTVERKVDARGARAAAKANESYGRALEAATNVLEERTVVSIKRRP